VPDSGVALDLYDFSSRLVKGSMNQEFSRVGMENAWDLRL
jgi:hypothetical protein